MRHYMGKRQYVLLAALVAIMILIIGCSSTSGPSAKSYGNDGYMGLSNSNPNIPGTPGYHTYAKDTDLMNQTLNAIPGITKHRIMLNGPRARVWIVLSPQLSDVSRTEVYNETLNALRDNMPRYAIKLYIAKS